MTKPGLRAATVPDDDHHGQAAREFRQTIRCVPGNRAPSCRGCRLVAVDIFGAQADDARGNSGLPVANIKRQQAMRHEVAQRPGAIGIIFAPAEIGVGVERLFVFDGRLPFVPIQILRRAPVLG